MKFPILLNLPDYLAGPVGEAEGIRPCQDCVGGLGIHVDGPDDWHVCVVHTHPCPHAPAYLFRGETS